MTVLVTGATGTTGAAVLSELSRRGVPFRAMVRKAGAALAAPPESVAVADFDDPAAIAAALAGVTRAYLVTPSSERAEAQQVRFVELAAEAGVGIVLLSQLAAAEDSPVRFLRYHAVVERRMRELGVPGTVLRPNLFFQGLLGFAPMIAGEGRFFAPIGDARVSAVDIRDIGAVAAAALVEDGHEGAAYSLTGPAALTHAEMAAGLSAALGREVTFADAPPEAFAGALAGILPEWQIGGTVEDYAHYARGEAAEVSTAVPDVTGRPAIDFATFARDYAGAFGG